MVLCVKVKKQDAEKARTHMIKRDIFAQGYRYGKDDDFLYFPVKEEFAIPKLALEFLERELEETELQPAWRDAAREILTEKEHNLGRFGYDSLGTIAVVEIVEELLPKEKELAQLLLDTDKKIETVLKKSGGHIGEFRTQEMIYLAGKETKETLLHENGCRFKINVETVYFSIRLSTERTRIMKLIVPGENILCMFSGAGPYPVVFAKKTDAKSLVAIEINPEGHKYGEQNAKMNKVEQKIKFYCGDVNKIVPELVKDGQKFDRITMPLPHTGIEFLPAALDAITSGGTI
ncbi:hypothetical protein GOV10_06355, partial [Candidatus Woesearchaeota archaeon]|nr:hypothetical protein [Candidatus Woesearchaeota archaeon]